MQRRLALVRRPGPRLAEGLTSRRGAPVNPGRALEQWTAYVEAMQGHGWRTVEVEPAPECPDAVFVEDAVVVYGDLAVIGPAAAPSRVAERPGVEAVLRRLGYRVEHLEPPAILDGGDVLKHDGRVWVGLSGRTNGAAVAGLARLLEPLGADVVAVPNRRVLHLKSALTMLPDGTAVGWQPVVDVPTMFEPIEFVPEEAGAHVVLLGDGVVLMSAAAPRSADAFAACGLTPVLVDIGEFEKLDGCVTCLSVRLRGCPAADTQADRPQSQDQRSP